MPYIPHTPEDRQSMLAAIGVGSTEDLFADIPPDARFKGDLAVPPSMPEWELTRHLKALAARNRSLDVTPSFLGAGAYQHFSPSLVDSLLQRAEYYSAYTPYQAEASQGTLMAIFEFQTIVSLLTGLEVANASLYDGASAAAEAVLMALAQTGRSRILMSQAVHPHYRETVLTYLVRHGEASVEEIPLRDGATDLEALERMLGDDVAAVCVQNPNFLGIVEDGPRLSSMAHAKEALLLVAVTDPIALMMVSAPGDYDADVAFGEAQPLGLPLSYGGPYVGFMAMPSKYVKRMPGRLVGKTTDHEGKMGYCLTLQAREQHIRREKAVSNICTNQSLCALATTLYVSALGRQGLREVAAASRAHTHYLAEGLAKLPGVSLRFPNRPYFHEVVVRAEGGVAWMRDALKAAGYQPGYELGRSYPELNDCMLFCATEVVPRDALDGALAALQAARAMSTRS
ncbi:MAG: aminomethyl-transferring glycine dehydrogenase subunit GcvPA [Candidatus Xenobia bacterium]